MPIYGPLKSVMLSVSPNVGTSETDQFGTITNYDRTMVTADTSVEIDEDDVLWIDGADTDGPWNYIVKKRAPWKNSISFAIQKVTVSQYNAVQTQIKDGLKLIEEIKQRAANKKEIPNAENKIKPESKVNPISN